MHPILNRQASKVEFSTFTFDIKSTSPILRPGVALQKSNGVRATYFTKLSRYMEAVSFLKTDFLKIFSNFFNRFFEN